MSAAVLTKFGKDWSVETQSFMVIGSTKAEAIRGALQRDESIDKIYDNMSTHTPQSYLNKSRKYGYRTYWGGKVSS